MNDRIRTAVAKVLLALWLSTSMSSTHAQSTGGGAQPPRAAAQPTRSTDDALLREVRLIREMLQQAQGSAQLEQMLVERIRTHDQRVERLDQQLDQVRDEIAGIEVHVRQTQDRDQSLEAQIQRASDPNQRQSLEGERKEMRFTQESQTQRLDRLRERESAIAASLQKEERTLRGLEARLEALDREMEAAARKKNASNPPGAR
jgi:predicted  nucleic acid-binding Zn-ribbon protein